MHSGAFTDIVVTILVKFVLSKYLSIRDMKAQIILWVQFFQFLCCFIFRFFDKKLFLLHKQVWPCFLSYLCNVAWVYLGASYSFPLETIYTSNLSMHVWDKTFLAFKRSSGENLFANLKLSSSALSIALTLKPIPQSMLQLQSGMTIKMERLC